MEFVTRDPKTRKLFDAISDQDEEFSSLIDRVIEIRELVNLTEDPEEIEFYGYRAGGNICLLLKFEGGSLEKSFKPDELDFKGSLPKKPKIEKGKRQKIKLPKMQDKKSYKPFVDSQLMYAIKKQKESERDSQLTEILKTAKQRDCAKLDRNDEGYIEADVKLGKLLDLDLITDLVQTYREHRGDVNG